MWLGGRRLLLYSSDGQKGQIYFESSYKVKKMLLTVFLNFNYLLCYCGDLQVVK